MHSVTRTVPALLAGSLMLAATACGGGGSSSPAAHAAAVPAQSTATAPPSAANRTAVGTASLTIVLPHVLNGKSGKALRAPVTASSRRPAYIDPTSGNLLDIYVDGTLIPDIDGVTAQTDSYTVQPTTFGSQTLNLPLYSNNLNQIVVIELDSSRSDLLAIGETNTGMFTPGTSQNLSLSLYINAEGIGIIDQPNQTSPAQLGTAFPGNQYTSLPLCSGGTPIGVFSLFPMDALGNFVAASGEGGVETVDLTYQQHDAGTSLVVEEVGLGTFQMQWDYNCDGVSFTADTYNPANFIFSDLNNNYGNYEDGFYGNSTNGSNQGIFNLFYGYQTVPVSILNQASTGFVYASDDIINS